MPYAVGGIYPWFSLVCGSLKRGTWSLRFGLRDQGIMGRKHLTTWGLAIVWLVTDGPFKSTQILTSITLLRVKILVLPRVRD